MAIYLHEIGHNFYLNPVHYKFFQIKNLLIQIIQALTNYNTLITNPSHIFTLLINILVILIGPKAWSMLQWSPKINILWKLNILINPIKKFFSSLLDGFKVILGLPISFLILFLAIFQVLIMVLVSLISFVISERFLNGSGNNEKFADAFSTSYGYGNDLSTALSKFITEQTDFRVLLKKNPGMYSFYLSIEAVLENVYAYSVPHPNLVDRANHSIEHLEMELEKNKNKLSKDQIKEIQETIKQLRSFKRNDMLLSTFDEVNETMDDIFPIRASKEKYLKSIMSDETVYDFGSKIFPKFLNLSKEEIFKDSNKLKA